MTSTLPPLVSVIPPDPPVPSLPSQEELDATLALFDAMAERDAERRRVRFEAKTARPPRGRR